MIAGEYPSHHPYIAPDVLLANMIQQAALDAEQMYDEPTTQHEKQQQDLRMCSLFIKRTEDIREPQQLLTVCRALAQWLPQCDLTFVNIDRADVHNVPALPATEMYRAIVNKLLRNGWMNSYDILRPVAESMVPLLQPTSSEGAAKSFAASAKLHIELRLRQLSNKFTQIYIPYSQDELNFVSALTDAGALDESLWGKIGILTFSDTTPFAISEEVYRRFVLEQRDCYAPVSERAHVDTIGKYCFNVIKQISHDETRHQANMHRILQGLGIKNSDALRMPLRSLVRMGNIITIILNQQAQEGTAPLELLSDKSRADVGEALRRILLVARNSAPHQLQHIQEYQDSVHVEIVNELGLLGADLRRLMGRIATPQRFPENPSS